jgi:FO synthase
MATPLFLQRRARKGPTLREVLLVHAVGRIAYRGWIDNIQVSWVKAGVDGARQALLAGCNDLGGTLMDENISRAAGASHGQELDENELRGIVEPLGRTLVQRTTLYGRTSTVGRRLRPTPEVVEADRISAASAATPVTLGPTRDSSR